LDTAGYASDEFGHLRYYDVGDGDSFDENTLGEIASLLKSDYIPFRKSMFPSQEPHQLGLRTALCDEPTCEPTTTSMPREHTGVVQEQDQEPKLNSMTKEKSSRTASSPTSAGPVEASLE